MNSDDFRGSELQTISDLLKITFLKNKSNSKYSIGTSMLINCFSNYDFSYL